MLRNDVVQWNESDAIIKRAVLYAILIHFALFMIVFPHVKKRVQVHQLPPGYIPVALHPYPEPPKPPPVENHPNVVRHSNLPIPVVHNEETPNLLPPRVPLPEANLAAVPWVLPAPPEPPEDPPIVLRTPGVDAPVGIYTPDPIIPKVCLEMHRGGIVIARIIIGVTGDVESVKILRTPKGVLGKILAERVSQTLTTWRYEPSTQEGKPVRVQMTVTTIFTIE